MYWIGGGIAALGLLTIYLVKKGNSGTTSNNVLASGNCPAGQVPCANNKYKCYDPTANYLLNPCATATTPAPTNPTTNDPIVEIVDGVIKLFKKKPAASQPTA